jgi:hypothetical protein
LLARTDWDQPKHRGLSYFILDMKQPGVTVHPLRQMNGYASFNQVFFTEPKVEPEFLVSDVGNGWAVTTTTLMHERRGADGLRSWAIASDKPGRIYDEGREEIRTTMEPYKWYPQRAGRVDLILERARATEKINDPVLRQVSPRQIGATTSQRPIAGGGGRLEPLCLGKPLGTTLWASRPPVAKSSTPLPPPQRIVRFHSPLTRR